jgi:hypothetical protein
MNSGTPDKVSNILKLNFVSIAYMAFKIRKIYWVRFRARHVKLEIYEFAQPTPIKVGYGNHTVSFI